MSEEKEPKEFQSGWSHIGEGIGRLFICVGVAIVIWAFAGFPVILK